MKQVLGVTAYMILVVLGIYRICLGQGLSAIVDLGFAGGIYLWTNPRTKD